MVKINMENLLKNKNTKYFRKQSAQLFSKMRFVAAQFLAYFENDLWKETATHANKMANLLQIEICFSICFIEPSLATVRNIFFFKECTFFELKYYFFSSQPIRDC